MLDPGKYMRSLSMPVVRIFGLRLPMIDKIKDKVCCHPNRNPSDMRIRTQDSGPQEWG